MIAYRSLALFTSGAVVKTHEIHSCDRAIYERKQLEAAHVAASPRVPELRQLRS